MSPAAVTAWISRFAQVVGFEADAAAAAVGTTARQSTQVRMRRPTLSSHRPGSPPPLGSPPMELEITPEPTAEERAAIEAALAETPQEPPLSWREEAEEP
jgi:hypothetical protein